jgi:hypothetical protein
MKKLFFVLFIISVIFIIGCGSSEDTFDDDSEFEEVNVNSGLVEVTDEDGEIQRFEREHLTACWQFSGETNIYCLKAATKVGILQEETDNPLSKNCEDILSLEKFKEVCGVTSTKIKHSIDQFGESDKCAILDGYNVAFMMLKNSYGNTYNTLQEYYDFTISNGIDLNYVENPSLGFPNLETGANIVGKQHTILIETKDSSGFWGLVTNTEICSKENTLKIAKLFREG